MKERSSLDPNLVVRINGLTEAEEIEAGTPRGEEADEVVKKQQERVVSPDDRDEI